MVYIPLHHKYRPQVFADLVGQEAISTTLTNAIVMKKIAPAYLFCGPRGTGKTSSARILAKSLNCLSTGEPTPKPCGKCEACKTIAAGTSLDTIEIDAASNTGVDNIREIIERAQYAPLHCRYKVYIIDECHMLSVAAFNSLLKTLEEPPQHVVFILATTDPQRVLPTIISRCQRFDYRRIPLESTINHLQSIANAENIDIDRLAITLVAQISQGGMRDAESLLDQLSLLGERVTIEAVWDLLGSVPERQLLGLLEAIVEDDGVGVLTSVRELLDRGKEPLSLLQSIAGFYRDLLIAKSAPERQDLTNITSETWPQVIELARRIELSTLLNGQQKLKESEVQIKNTTQPRLWLEITICSLLPAAVVTTIASRPNPIIKSDIKNPIKPKESPFPDGSNRVDIQPTISEESNSPIATNTSTNLDATFAKILSQLSPASQGFFQACKCRLRRLEGNCAIFAIEGDNFFKMAQGVKQKELEIAAKKVLGELTIVRLEMSGNSTGTKSAKSTKPTNGNSATTANPTPSGEKIIPPPQTEANVEPPFDDEPPDEIQELSAPAIPETPATVPIVSPQSLAFDPHDLDDELFGSPSPPTAMPAEDPTEVRRIVSQFADFFEGTIVSEEPKLPADEN
jgi:DNA polymerase-3 subunit gamma/tau